MDWKGRLVGFVEMTLRKLENLNIALITHIYAIDFLQMLRDWTQERVETLACIEHPLLPKWGTKTTITIYGRYFIQELSGKCH